MSESHQREAAIFDAAMELPPEQRAAYLDQACGGDVALRGRIESLLKAEESRCEFLDPPTGPAVRPTLQTTAPLTEKPGDWIGRYKLLQQIGEGGCGVVYMAEQAEPVRRRVALKIIKLGMDTRSVITRFEAERQALALMDHPNIAKVLDAGATDTGRPYFVMELVRGMKITEFCDEQRLSTRARLDLFIKVCQAIQHAHQKGIIHRDIKPSNTLVTVNDGVAVPKIIDFGIVKATGGQQLTNKTLFTAFEQFIGTPAYMSPEQAVLTSLDIDTRSDIYALGVLLYELLTGQTPFDPKELLAVGLDEMRRTIREKEPPKPSTCVSTLPGDDRGTAARHRGLEGPRLVSELRGDLDWIVMKCLEKERARRYETANGLAADIQRHLNNEPVVACPPSRLYRFQKTVRRNKMIFAAGAAVAAALLVGLGTTTWMFFHERAALRRAVVAEQAQTRLRQEAETEAAKSRQVAQLLQDILEGVGASIASVLTDQGKLTEAEVLYREGLDMSLRLLGNEHPIQRVYLANLAKVQQARGDLTEAETLYRRALEKNRKLLGNAHPRVAKCLDDLATVLARQGKWKEAAHHYGSLIQRDPAKPDYYHGLAPVLAANGDLGKYRALCKEIVARFGDTSRPFVSDKMAKDCSMLPSSGTDPEAVAKMAEAAAATGPVNRSFAYFQCTAGMVEYRRGRFAAALTFEDKSIAIHEGSSGHFRNDTIYAEALAVSAMARFQLRQIDAARAALAKADIIAARLPKLDSGDLGSHYSDWIIAHKLLEEATKLIEGIPETKAETN